MKWVWAVILAMGALMTPLRAQEHNHIQIAQLNTPAVVTINVLRQDGTTLTATGFVLTPDGLVATCRHVLQDSLYANLTFSNGATSAEALLLAQDPQTDIALLKIEAQHLPQVKLATSQEVLPGQTITVIGNPRRLQNTVTSGIISQVRLQKDNTLWYQISAPISPSSSGSPIFNSQGEVIGMAFASMQGEGNQNLNFAIPVHYIQQLAAQQDIALGETEPLVQKQIHPFVRHIQRSWQITKRLFKQWFSNENKD